MKAVLSRLACLALLPLSSCVVPKSSFASRQVSAPSLVAELQDENGRVLVVAHRACWADGAPENSLAAIEACIEMGADVAEIDVVLSADGVPVLFHDSDLARMTDGVGAVGEHSLEQLKSLRLRSGSGGPDAPLTDQRIPTLEEVLELTKGKILTNLDAKGDVFAPAVEIAERAGVTEQILMKTAAPPDAPELRNAAFWEMTLFMPIIGQCPAKAVSDICNQDLGERAGSYDQFDPVAFEVIFSDPDFLAQGVPAMTALGGRVWVNTLSPWHAAGIVDDDAAQDPAGTWGRLIALGVDMIQTDAPEELIAYLQQSGMK